MASKKEKKKKKIEEMFEEKIEDEIDPGCKYPNRFRQKPSGWAKTLKDSIYTGAMIDVCVDGTISEKEYLELKEKLKKGELNGA